MIDELCYHHSLDCSCIIDNSMDLPSALYLTFPVRIHISQYSPPASPIIFLSLYLII